MWGKTREVATSVKVLIHFIIEELVSVSASTSVLVMVSCLGTTILCAPASVPNQDSALTPNKYGTSRPATVSVSSGYVSLGESRMKTHANAAVFPNNALKDGSKTRKVVIAKNKTLQIFQMATIFPQSSLYATTSGNMTPLSRTVFAETKPPVVHSNIGTIRPVNASAPKLLTADSVEDI